VVVTPPDHRVRPIELTGSIPPLWLLDAERLPVRRDGQRWLHVTRVRARVREAPGEYAWPAQRIEVETPDGGVAPLLLEAQPFVVASASDMLPDRLEPFGLRAPIATEGTGSRLAAALLGSAATLLTLAGVRLVRLRRAARWKRSGRAEPGRDDGAPWIQAERALRLAREALEADPRAAADDAALALRRYLQLRSGRALESLTTEEIASQRPPGRVRTRWPEFIALLRRLDALRFPGHLDDAGNRERLCSWIDDALGFVERSVPPRELR